MTKKKYRTIKIGAFVAWDIQGERIIRIYSHGKHGKNRTKKEARVYATTDIPNCSQRILPAIITVTTPTGGKK